MSAPRWLGRLALALAALPAVAVAQQGAPVDQLDVSPFFRGTGGFLGTLVVGALLLLISPDYVDRLVDRIHDEAFESFLWGLLVLVGFVVVVVMLVLSIVGVFLVVPLAIVFAVVAVVGNAIGYIALFGRAVESHWVALIAGAAVAGLTNLLPIVGGIVGFVVGSLGIGAIVRNWRR